MTQIVVTLDNNADESLLRRMIENMKGVVKTSITSRREVAATNQSTLHESQWIKSLHKLKDSIDKSVIDYSDPRTDYIMSK